jgi:hypothetical protein
MFQQSKIWLFLYLLLIVQNSMNVPTNLIIAGIPSGDRPASPTSIVKLFRKMSV